MSADQKGEAPEVRHEKIIIERFEAGGWGILYPDGKVDWCETERQASQQVRARARRRANRSKAMLVMELEWRNTPADWQPPEG